jgi:hypothetical protein
MNIVTELAGRWLVNKVRRQAQESGIRQAAANLKKQGAPFGLAYRLLIGRPQ